MIFFFSYLFKNALKFPRFRLLSERIQRSVQPAEERPAAPRRMQRAVMRLGRADEEDGSGAWMNHTRGLKAKTSRLAGGRRHGRY